MLASLRLLMPAGLLASSFLFTGCGPQWEPPGQERTETRTIPLDKSDEVAVDLRMGAGELRVRGGSDNLMDGRFTYNRLRLRPEVSYNTAGFRSHLTVEEPNNIGVSGHRYTWELQFNNQKPLDLRVKCGAGETRLDLEGLTLRHVEVEIGVGELKMDLRGTPTNDYSVSVHGGIGEATVYLPQNVGIEADVQGGIGEIHTPGLLKRDGRYVNDSYGRAKTNVHLEVRGGIGEIHLIAN